MTKDTKKGAFTRNETLAKITFSITIKEQLSNMNGNATP